MRLLTRQQFVFAGHRQRGQGLARCHGCSVDALEQVGKGTGVLLRMGDLPRQCRRQGGFAFSGVAGFQRVVAIGHGV